MKFNGLAVFLLVVACGLAGWAGYERHLKSGLEKKLAAITQERDALRVTANKKLALGSKTEVKEDGPEGLGPDHAKALQEEAAKNQPKPTPGAAESDKNPMAGMADMMKDPAMRDMMKAQMRSQVEFLYRDFFDLLGLDPDKQDKLTKLMGDRMTAGMDAGLSMMGGAGVSKEEKDQQMAAMKEATEASDNAIKALLGDDDFAKFQSYEKSQPERQQLATLNSQLKEKGVPLSEEAESRLMDAMFQERTNFKYENDFADQKNFDPSKFTAENIKRFQEQQEQLRGNILTKVEGILSPEQMQIFRDSQKQQAAMEKMGMEMGLKMMGGDK